MAKDVLHVVPQDENWGVKREGNERNSSTHTTQKEAIEAARELAREGDDIVIHRPDGTIRDRITYTGSNGVTTASGNRAAEPHDLISVGSRVSWQAILAGVAVAGAVYLLLTLLALAIGVSTMDHIQNRTFAISGAIVGLVSLLAALFLGGNVASRLSTRETRGEAILYGIILWAGFFFLVTLAGMNVGGSLGQMSLLGKPAAVAEAPQPPRTEAQERAQAKAEEVANRTETVVADMKPATMAWWAFGVMVLSMLAAIGGSVVGAGPEFVFSRFGPAEARPATVRPTT
ncbi:MAG TPA: DUF2188 domain-containing protein [Gemmataceae bacterium]|jgi:hypothetical protein|nr:DUF2188 domain-containing protein [Gemmataceae bacterium]